MSRLITYLPPSAWPMRGSVGRCRALLVWLMERAEWGAWWLHDSTSRARLCDRTRGGRASAWETAAIIVRLALGSVGTSTPGPRLGEDQWPARVESTGALSEPKS